MAEIVSFLDATLESDAILTNGAGNYSGFLHRFYKFKDYGTQLAPTSGSMGYGKVLCWHEMCPPRIICGIVLLNTPHLLIRYDQPVWKMSH